MSCSALTAHTHSGHHGSVREFVLYPKQPPQAPAHTRHSACTPTHVTQTLVMGTRHGLFSGHGPLPDKVTYVKYCGLLPAVNLAATRLCVP